MEDDAGISFLDPINEAKRALIVLDSVTGRDHPARVARAVSNGKLVYEELRRHQSRVRMNAWESHELQTAIDLLKARLKFFGEPV